MKNECSLQWDAMHPPHNYFSYPTTHIIFSSLTSINAYHFGIFVPIRDRGEGERALKHEDKSNNVFREILKCFRKTAKFKFFAKQIIYLESPDHPLQNDV